jgi:hypothetical protein
MRDEVPNGVLAVRVQNPAGLLVSVAQRTNGPVVHRELDREGADVGGVDDSGTEFVCL